MDEMILEFYDEEFISIILDILKTPEFNELKNFGHHYNCTRWQHSINVAYLTYKFCKKHRLNTERATRAALVHDLFLYDWRKKAPEKKWHPAQHPEQALIQAKKLIEIDELMEDCIIKHMWPLTLKFPKYKESWVVQYADKMSAISECTPFWIKNLRYSSALLMLCLIF